LEAFGPGLERRGKKIGIVEGSGRRTGSGGATGKRGDAENKKKGRGKSEKEEDNKD